MSDIGVFKIFIVWENLIYDSASITTNEFSRLAEFDENWNRKMKEIVYNLAKAWAGKTLNDGETEVIKNSLYTLRGIFNDIFEKKINLISPENIDISEGNNVDIQIIGKINTKLLFDMNVSSMLYPGNVYKLEDLPPLRNMVDKKKVVKDAINWNTLKQIYDENYKDLGISRNKFNQEFEEAVTQKAEFVYLEVTPICDFVQSKMTLSRLVLGTLYPVSLSLTINDEEKTHEQKPLIKQRTEFLYISPIFEYKNDFYFIVFDFRYFTSITADQIKDKNPIFRLRKELLSDLQIKLSSHINRTGVLYLE